jgi:tRNA1(Val) A37 N6-methylase TrmN6
MIEQERGHAFNLDTVLLQHFVKLPYRIKHVIDVGTGNGAIALYLTEKTKAKITAIEIQKNRYEQAVKNVFLNQLDTQISVIYGDYLKSEYKDVDVIVCNPPFFKVQELEKINQDESIAKARHEISLNISDLIEKVSQQLKYGGKFFMIHRPERFYEIINLLNTHDLVVKRLQFVHPYIDKKPNHVLFECVKKGGLQTIIEPPIIIYKDKHEFTNQAKNIFGGDIYVT